MIISCEKCATNYVVPDQALSLGGRQVRCAKCGHIWMAKQEKPAEPAFTGADTATMPPKTEEITPQVQLPQTITPSPQIIQKTSIWLIFLSIALPILAIFLYIVFYNQQIINYWPAAKDYYKKLGIYDTSGITLSNMDFIKEKTPSGSLTLIIRGTIVNNSTQKLFMPMIKIAVKDEKFNRIASNTINHSDKVLEPGDIFIINNQITDITDNTAFVSFDIGNRLALYFR